MAEELEEYLMQVSEDELYQMFKTCNMTPDDVKVAREAIIEYCSKQEHLKGAVQCLNKTYVIEGLLYISNGSTELCKQRVERMLVARSLLPDFVHNRNMEEFRRMLDNGNHCFMPKRIPNEYSVVAVIQLNSNNADDFCLLTYMRYFVMMGEYTRYRYSSHACRYIIDLKNWPMSIVTKLNPFLLKKSETLVSDYYGIKVKGIHLVNAPNFVDKVVGLLKMALKPKLAARIQVHSTYEGLYEYIPKEVLPKEFGGYDDSCREVTAKWRALFQTEEGRQKVQLLEKLVSDESKRQKPQNYEDHLGMPGTFKNLEVD